MGRAKALKTLSTAATAVALLIAPAHAQGFGKKSPGSGPPVENHPKVDEKAYKAALDRIPVSSEKYDPWGIARQPAPQSIAKETKQSKP